MTKLFAEKHRGTMTLFDESERTEHKKTQKVSRVSTQCLVAFDWILLKQIAKAPQLSKVPFFFKNLYSKPNLRTYRLDPPCITKRRLCVSKGKMMEDGSSGPPNSLILVPNRFFVPFVVRPRAPTNSSRRVRSLPSEAYMLETLRTRRVLEFPAKQFGPNSAADCSAKAPPLLAISMAPQAPHPSTRRIDSSAVPPCGRRPRFVRLDGGVR